MKTTTSIIGLVFFLLTACCKDEMENNTQSNNDSNETTTVLLKRKISTEKGSISQSTHEFIYTGTKLDSTTNSTPAIKNFETNIFTYTNNQISGIKRLWYGNEINNKEYFYNSENKLSEIKSIGAFNKSKSESHVYNQNGTINSTYYTGTAIQGTSVIFRNEFNEVIKLEYYDNNGKLYKTKTYTYDNKNNPYKNITGIAIFKFAKHDPFLIKSGSSIETLGDHTASDFLHNVTSEKVVFENGNTKEFNYSYEYNALDYPTKCIETKTSSTEDTIITTTEFFY